VKSEKRKVKSVKPGVNESQEPVFLREPENLEDMILMIHVFSNGINFH